MFCYNPVDFARQEDELSTEDWLRVLRQGREMGAVQLGLSGGEPLVRDDLEVIVAEARSLGYYTNLLTSGVGLTAARAASLKAAGLEHRAARRLDLGRQCQPVFRRRRCLRHQPRDRRQRGRVKAGICSRYPTVRRRWR